MQTLTYSFLSVNNALSISSEVKNEDVIPRLIGDWISLFEHKIDSKTGKIQIEGLQKKSTAFIEGFNSYFTNYASIIPRLHKVKKFMDSLNENEYFLFLPIDNISKEDFHFGRNHLKALQENKSYEDIKKEFDETLGKILKTYQFAFADGSRQYFFGEQDKAQRSCRYCGRNQENGVTFKNTAHTISEALGNKKIFTNDECDSCNEHFSRTIEKDIITYLDLYRVLLSVKGKGGLVKVKGKNFTLSNDGELKITMYCEPKEDRKTDYNLKLEYNSKVALQNIYKSLSKFAIGIIPNQRLNDFGKAIDFINGTLKIERLPKVAYAINLYGLITHPQIFIYIRKKQNINCPLGFVLFKFGIVAYLFILPSFLDKKDFTDEKDFKKFWKSIPPEISSRNWNFYDFSDSKSKNFSSNLIFKQMEANYY